MRYFKILWLILLLVGCSDFLGTWEGYVIPKGDHYSHRTGMLPRVVSLFKGEYLHFQARFTPSCIYVPRDSSINKLYGFTDCNSSVHENSLRFGWRVRHDSTIDLFAYWYLDGTMKSEYMGKTIVNAIDDYEIQVMEQGYYFKFNEALLITPRNKTCEHGLRVRLFPYFGGNDTAPQDMTIMIYEYE